MNVNQVVLAKIILALHNQKVDIPDADAIAYFQYNPFTINHINEDGKEEVLVTKDQVMKIMLALGPQGVADPEPPRGYMVGDKVQAKFGGQDVIGPITGIFYKVDGCGKKYYKVEEILKAD